MSFYGQVKGASKVMCKICPPPPFNLPKITKPPTFSSPGDIIIATKKYD